MAVRKHRCPNPKCRKVLMIPAEMQGREVRCADCGELFVVPMRFKVTPASGRTSADRLRKAS